MSDVSSPGRASSASDPVVVGIGASAGGLAALRTFFTHVTEDTGFAFVVVVHLSPEQRSHLPDLLQSYTRIPVTQVTGSVRLEPNHVYVIPPGANLESIDTHLRLSELEQSRRERAPIDHFFRTLADTHDGHAIGVILSGTGSDGALGIREISRREGLTVAQDPSEAEFSGMPESAVATGMVDLILPLNEIPAALIRYANTRPHVPKPTDEGELEQEPLKVLQRIFAQIRARTDRDFTRYKRATVMRRIERRMQLRQVVELSAYLDLLRESDQEVRALADDLLITVTSFFRDPEAWEHIRTEVVPQLFEGKTSKDSVRVWSVGCATGEEAYSMAILLLEEAERHEDAPEIQMFASDLHEKSLVRAREGFFPGEIEHDVRKERLLKFFLKEKGGYRVRREVREMVVFAPHDILSDPPFSQIDLILCRNLLIYLQRDVQRDVVELFHYGLRPDGLLWLGTAETLELSDLFGILNKAQCVYRKRNVGARDLRLRVFPMAPLNARKKRPVRESSPEPMAYGTLHERMVERYAPPSMLLNPDDKVVHLSENAGRYLSLPGGELTSSAVKLVREELRVELRTALHSAHETGQPVRSDPIPVALNGETRLVVIDVRPSLQKEHEGSVLVYFDEREDPKESTPKRKTRRAKLTGSTEELEGKLRVTTDRLQAIIEEYESSQEEMTASHEELQSANEELRSTMEELETSKEELQSMNEELQTVNQENRHKVEELAELTSDLQNLFSATDIATLFLDRDLRILRFTQKVSDLFNILPGDRGRPISDFSHGLGYSELIEDALSVLKTLRPIERELADKSGRWYLTRILPYRSTDDRIEGVVLTFIDITRRRQAERDLAQSEERFRRAFDNLLDPFTIYSPVRDAHGEVVDFRIEHANAAASKAAGSQGQAYVGRTALELYPQLRQTVVFELYLNALTDQRAIAQDRLPVDAAGHGGLGTRFFDLRIAPVGDGVAVASRDVTEQVAHEQALRDAKRVADLANETKTDFLATVSHELRTPLNSIVGYTELLLSGVPKPIVDDVVRQHVTRIERSARHLRDIIEDVLAFSRLEGQSEQLTQTIVSVPELLDELRAVMEPLFQRRGLEFTLDDTDAPRTFRADTRKLRQILLNLLGNAAKFTTLGSVGLRIAQDDGHVLFAVSDTGPGIDREKQGRVFEPFWRGNALDGGAGLGLTISRRYAEMMGGTLSVDSSLGKGSTFTLQIPTPPPRERAVHSGQG